MKNLVLHPSTRQMIDLYIKSPSHAVMLVGPPGSGKKTLAARLIEGALELQDDSFADYPYTLKLVVASDKKLIAIEAVRQLEQFLSRKVPGSTKYNRAVIIEDAHLLSHEAQNALLKTLEEPPVGTLIVLTVNHEQALLPTIRSRTQTIQINRPSRSDLEQHFSKLRHETRAIEQAYTISGGLPGLMHDILSQEEHPLSQATSTARQLLSQTSYERLLGVETLAKDRQLAADTAYIMQQMARISLQAASGATAKRWQQILAASYNAAEALAHSSNLKLTLTNLMLSL
jgi:replication-associated recombination protein RarA